MKIDYEGTIECDVLNLCSTVVTVREIRSSKPTIEFLKTYSDIFKSTCIWREETSLDPCAVSVEAMIDFYVGEEWIARKFVWMEFRFNPETLELEEED